MYEAGTLYKHDAGSTTGRPQYPLMQRLSCIRGYFLCGQVLRVPFAASFDNLRYLLINQGLRIMGKEGYWLDLSPFVSYMLEVFEDCLINAALSKNELTETEAKLLERMNRVGLHAEITVKKAKDILDCSEYSARRVLTNLIDKGYLSLDSSQRTYVYRLQQHMPNV